MPRKTSSQVWVFFDRRELSKGAGTCTCLFPVSPNETCGHQVRTKHGSTSPMRSHLDNHHGDWETKAEEVSRERNGSIVRFAIKRKRDDDETWSNDEIYDLLHRGILEQGLSFNILADPTWRILLSQPIPVVPWPSTARQRVAQQAETFRQGIHDELRNQNFISLSADVWTSQDQKKCMAVLASYIDHDMTLQTRLLGLEEMNTSSHANNLKNALMTIVKRNSIIASKQVVAVVTDSDASILAAVRQWRNESPSAGHSERSGGSVANCDRLVSLPCMAHIMHNAVNDALNLEEVRKIVNKIRKLMTKVKGSSNLTRDLKNAQKRANKPIQSVILDMRVRWHSTFAMLDRFLKIREELRNVVINAASISDETKIELEECCLEPTAMSLQPIVVILRDLCQMSRELEREDSPTFSSVLLMFARAFRQTLTQNDDDVPTIGRFKQAIRAGFYERLNKHDVAGARLALYFDPRFKPNGSHADLARESGLVKWINEQCDANQDLVYFLKHLVRILPQDTLPEELRSREEQQHTEAWCLFRAPKNMIERCIETELQRYLMISVKQDDTAASFWKREGGRLPLMREAARIVLGIPASSAGPERIFSSALWVRNDRRTRMDISTLNDFLSIRYHTSKAMTTAEAAHSNQLSHVTDDPQAVQAQSQ